jgi:hypothetical protein
LNENLKTNNKLTECCVRGFDIHNINQRANELQDPYEDLGEECKLLAEAEECGVSILLTTNGSFKDNLQRKAKNNLRILHPIHDLNEIVK